MPVYHDCRQYSDEWDALRIGIPTSSGFEKILTPLGKTAKTETWKNYAHGIIAEKILGRRMDTFMSPWMERGQMIEQDAIGQYELMRDVDTQVIGFVTDDLNTMGCSPDRLVGEDGLLEIKCPKPNTQVGYLIGHEKTINFENRNICISWEREYYPQLQGQLFITGRQWVDIMAYHPEFPPAILRVPRDEEYIDLLKVGLDNFVTYMEDKILYIASLTERK